MLEINICCLAAYSILFISYKIPSFFVSLTTCVCVTQTHQYSKNSIHNNIQLPKQNDRTIHIAAQYMSANTYTHTSVHLQHFLCWSNDDDCWFFSVDGWLAGSSIGFWYWFNVYAFIESVSRSLALFFIPVQCYSFSCCLYCFLYIFDRCFLLLLCCFRASFEDNGVVSVCVRIFERYKKLMRL